MTQAHLTPHWHAHADADHLAQAVTDRIVKLADQALADHGAFHMVLAGGGTPKRIYQRLAASACDWSGWHIYFGDERCLAPDHAERNSRMAAESWLDHVPIPPDQRHPMPAERGAEEAAEAYSKVLDGLGDFDVVLLGLGEDGHTASLFPGQEWGTEPSAPDALAVHDAPKPPPDRVSLSANRLSRAAEVIFLVSGEGKREAVEIWCRDGSIPAAAVTPDGGAYVYHDLSGLD
ncbi:6-phosphogluconolactonase [Magnetospira sp. QH-2]|uniref:6-phosphogluconolactonase n=1 Tax=Magnetospira sp. (strain QH-2) TaxID=1288970 RepID=UPI0003E80BA1|nr:6-phosphogluconolactonase [Magnetospira sp. QH-2]CCQ72271.1 6-phosphogluconolactonase [Magnetospira sp. QH-2]